MRVVLMPALLMGISCTAPNAAEDALGVWQVRADHSTVPHPGVLAVRFEKHGAGEVFTLDTVDTQGRSATFSTILYFDGKPRDFQDSACSGTQSSRRLEGNTVEILRHCADGQWVRLVRQLSGRKELVLDITELKPGGGRQEWHLVLTRQTRAGTNTRTGF